MTASEPVIYGRFGYGQASWSVRATIPRHRGELRLPAGTEDVRLRLVPLEDSAEIRSEVYRRQVARRPGMTALPPKHFELLHLDLPQHREGFSVRRAVLAERGGETVGYAVYRTKLDERQGGQFGLVDVHTLFADDPAARAALLRYLMEIDLTASISFPNIAIDDPLLYMLANVRAAEPNFHDALYLRLVDVDRALTQRSYSAPLDIVFEVADAVCPWNAGRWRLSADAKGAVCERTQDEPDIELDVRELGATYLGGTTFSALRNAGLVTERREGAVTEASRAFAWDVAPHLAFGF
jgi:predicted acetyltransferase